MQEVIVILCADTEPDRPFLGSSSRYNVYCQKYSWNGIRIGVPAIDNVIRSHIDSYKENAKMTWFLRADETVKVSCGNSAYLFEHFDYLWKKLMHEGDEIGWHCHLFRWSDTRKCWKQEIEDRKWMEYCLDLAYNDIAKRRFKVTSTSMGWHYHNDETMRKLDSLQIIVDLSALPGLSSHGKLQDIYNKTSLSECYDWSLAPLHPYFPSSRNYMKEGTLNERLSILEIPSTIVRGKPWIIDRMIHSDEAVVHAFSEARQKKGRAFLLGFLHPDEVIVSHLNALKGFFLKHIKGLSIQNLERSLNLITEASERMNIPFKYMTATQAAKVYIRDANSGEGEH